ncbi:DNA polymerase delta small subunit [Thecamonas trahens ATCC 50062]|uniref:DNA polymerase delta small subunit n=1 Tax=Thecamonas trahens ATCC 50062 TaxID=461836 RepID=A0A0L0DPQ1_THETB|nr:DNA polymerase delta small subunit [Thecamonas trahens ATCC 50062]KNC54001.1 DNA polymerase delta small subunit [Thecamonas trahens ATCC 50062]|eukprot:XP_013754017.1 DNA polymerase delta small subunit [Thecamonas trahens ATCC 50062]
MGSAEHTNERTCGGDGFVDARGALVIPPGSEYKQQYAHLKVKAVVGAATIVSVLELSEEMEDVVLIGTLFKCMPKKHTILDEYVKEAWVAPPTIAASYASADDSLILEDDSGRVNLTGSKEVLRVGTVVTGVVVGVRGGLNADGEFEVTQVYYPGTDAVPRVVPVSDESAPDKMMLLVSDLGIGANDSSSQLARDLLMDWVAGAVGDGPEVGLAAAVERVVIAGNALAAGDAPETRKVNQAPRLAMDAISELDAFVAGIAACVPVVVMSGGNDPTNFFHPLQALHRSLLPKAGRFETLTLAPSPYAFDLGDIRVAGECGDAINDVRRYVDAETAGDPAGLVSSIVQWRHTAPTAPETLAAYPFKDNDPFILDEVPNVYFAGAQPQFGVTGAACNAGASTCVAVPSFRTTHTAVLVALTAAGAVHSVTPLKFEVNAQE